MILFIKYFTVISITLSLYQVCYNFALSVKTLYLVEVKLSFCSVLFCTSVLNFTLIMFMIYSKLNPQCTFQKISRKHGQTFDYDFNLVWLAIATYRFILETFLTVHTSLYKNLILLEKNRFFIIASFLSQKLYCQNARDNRIKK